MDKLSFKKLGVVLCSVLFFSSSAFSQFDNIDFLRSGPADGVKFLQAYVAPMANAFGAGLNSGWYNTAKPHKFGGFDITTSVNMGFVPESATTFDVSKIGLTSLSGTGMAPTVAGPTTDGPPMTLSEEGVTLASFRTPPGSGWKIMPVPVAQVGLGLPFGTEVKGRFIPKITIKDGSISLWGIGVMHSIMQYIPGDELLPFDVSLFGGYTKLEGEIPLSLKPETGTGIVYAITSPYGPESFEDQSLEMTVTAMNVGAIASLNLPVVTFYGGLGYSKTRTEMELEGNFPTPSLVDNHAEYNNGGIRKGDSFAGLDIENFSGLRANIGMRIKLAVITIHGDFTRAQYNVVSAGLGVSFR